MYLVSATILYWLTFEKILYAQESRLVIALNTLVKIQSNVDIRGIIEITLN